MADRRRGKQRRRDDMMEKPTKEEYAVAKHLRFNLPARQGKLVGMTVQYFLASKAVDMLLESKWGVTKAKENALFGTRSSCIDYLDRLLQKGMFHRAMKIEKKKERDKKKKKPTKEEVEEAPKDEEKKVKKEKKSKKKEEKDEQSEKEKEVEKEKESEEEKKEDEKKKKKKVRLEMHNSQVFKDGSEVYVWIYDPVPMKTFIIGLLLVLGAVAVCLFPLWPPEVRLGVYYLSLTAAGFVGFMLALCVVRLILFCLVWAATIGKHYFWFLPNLTEDVGFFDSFRPLYKHEVYEVSAHKPNDDSIKDTDDPAQKDSKDNSQKVASQIEDTKQEEIIAPQQEDEEQEGEKNDEIEQEIEENDSGKEETGSENDNGYEFVDRNDFEEEEEDDDEQGQSGSDEEPETKKDK